MVRVAAVGVAAALLGCVLRRNVPEFSLLLTLAAGAWIIAAAAGALGAALELMRELAGMAGVSEVLLEPVIKVVVISVLTKLTAEICRSAGEGGVAAFVESAGTFLALAAALPLVRAVTSLMSELLT